MMEIISKLQDFHFLRPYFLILCLVPFILSFFKRESTGDGGISSSWQKICDSYLLPHLILRSRQKGKKTSSNSFSLGFIILSIAMAGPAYEKHPVVAFKTSMNIVIVSDMSSCMRASDFSPDRTSRLRMKLYDLLKELKGNNVGFILYDNYPYIVSPLTSDVKIIENVLPSVSPAIMPIDGERPVSAVKKAREMLINNDVKNGIIILTTCSGKIYDLKQTAEMIKSEGYHLFILGAGTIGGAPVPDMGGFVKDGKGNILMSKIDRNAYESIAKIGGGEFALMSSNNTDIRKLMYGINKVSDADKKEKQDIELDVWKDMGGIVALFALPFFIPIFKKGFLIFLLCFFMMGDGAKASTFEDLWLNNNQQAKKAYLNGDYKKAKEKFENYFLKGISAYKDHDFAMAEDMFKQDFAMTGNIESLYNLGNSLAFLEKYEEAIKVYEEVLKKDESHDDALYNKEYLERLLEQQQQQQQEQQQEQQKENNQGGKSKSSDKNKGDSSEQNADENNDGEESEQQENQDNQEGKDKSSDKNKDDDSEQNADENNDGEESEQQENKDNQEGEDKSSDKDKDSGSEQKPDENKDGEEGEQQKSQDNQEGEDKSSDKNKDDGSKQNTDENNDGEESKQQKNQDNQEGEDKSPDKSKGSGSELNPDEKNDGEDKSLNKKQGVDEKDDGAEEKDNVAKQSLDKGDGKEENPNGACESPESACKGEKKDSSLSELKDGKEFYLTNDEDGEITKVLIKVYDEPGDLLKNRLKKAYDKYYNK